MLELLELQFHGVGLLLDLFGMLCLGAILDIGTEVGKTIEGEDLAVPDKLEVQTAGCEPVVEVGVDELDVGLGGLYWCGLCLRGSLSLHRVVGRVGVLLVSALGTVHVSESE